MCSTRHIVNRHCMFEHTLSYRTTIICRSYRPTTDQITLNYRPIVSCRPTAFRIAE